VGIPTYDGRRLKLSMTTTNELLQWFQDARSRSPGATGAVSIVTVDGFPAVTARGTNNSPRHLHEATFVQQAEVFKATCVQSFNVPLGTMEPPGAPRLSVSQVPYSATCVIEQSSNFTIHSRPAYAAIGQKTGPQEFIWFFKTSTESRTRFMATMVSRRAYC
jgi:hypothetical protein